MSSDRFDATIELAPGPSARAVIALFWLHALPLALLLATPLEGPVMAVIALGIGGSWLWLRRHPAFGFGPRALAKLVWHVEGNWTLETAAGTRFEARLRGNSVLLGPACVLDFDIDLEGGGVGRRARILLGDELDEPLRRRLHARLEAAR